MINRAFLTKGQQKILDQHKKAPGWIYGLVRREKEKVQRWRRPGTPFSIGQQQVFLPSFTITLLHTPNISPTFAQFLVPLSFNKLDLRDYLFHAYNVRVLSVRSFIKQHPITRVESGSWRDLPGKRQLFRPKSTKKMMVELDKPFVWPEAPKDLSKWDHDRFSALEQDRALTMRGEKNEEPLYEQRLSISEQAARLLEGKEKWKGVDPGLAPSVAGGSGSRQQQSSL